MTPVDADCNKSKTVVDIATGVGTFWNGPMAGLLPFKRDSSLLVDSRTLAMLVLDANGDVARVMAVTSVRDAPSMVRGPFGTSGYDARGRVVFRGPPSSGDRSAGDRPRGHTWMPRLVTADSAPVLRIDLATRGRVVVTVDYWGWMPDVRVAVVRGTDYHIA